MGGRPRMHQFFWPSWILRWCLWLWPLLLLLLVYVIVMNYKWCYCYHHNCSCHHDLHAIMLSTTTCMIYCVCKCSTHIFILCLYIYIYIYLHNIYSVDCGGKHDDCTTVSQTSFSSFYITLISIIYFHVRCYHDCFFLIIMTNSHKYSTVPWY